MTRRGARFTGWSLADIEWESVIIFAFIGVLAVGLVWAVVHGYRVAQARPPRIVASRDKNTTLSSYNCGSAKAPIMCQQTITTYLLITRDGATCSVPQQDYYVPEGTAYKCLQLFGWQGGAKDPTEYGVWK